MRFDAGKQLTELELEQVERNARSATAGMSASASAEMVNRTHRVVRERARKLQARRSKMRSLWIPLAVSGSFLVVIVCAVWMVIEQLEESPNGLIDANQQLLVLMMWCLPLSVVLLAVVWFRRGSKTDSENAR